MFLPGDIVRAKKSCITPGLSGNGYYIITAVNHPPEYCVLKRSDDSKSNPVLLESTLKKSCDHFVPITASTDGKVHVSNYLCDTILYHDKGEERSHKIFIITKVGAGVFNITCTISDKLFCGVTLESLQNNFSLFKLWDNKAVDKAIDKYENYENEEWQDYYDISHNPWKSTEPNIIVGTEYIVSKPFVLYTFKFEPGEIFKVTGKSHYYHKTTNLLGESKEATAYQINNSCELYENAKFSIQIDKLNASSISDQCEIKKISKHTNNKRSAIWRVRKNFCLREQLQGRSLNHEDFFKVVELRASEGIYLCRLCDQSLIGLNESQMKSCEVFTT